MQAPAGGERCRTGTGGRLVPSPGPAAGPWPAERRLNSWGGQKARCGEEGSERAVLEGRPWYLPCVFHAWSAFQTET